jgi:hypothetical protein
VYHHFAIDFGGLRPWVVREWQWYTAKNTGSARRWRRKAFN